MADQMNNPNNTPNRGGNQSDGQGERNRDLGNESGRVGTGTERERGTVQEPGTQPDRDRQGGGSQDDEIDRDRGGL